MRSQEPQGVRGRVRCGTHQASWTGSVIEIEIKTDTQGETQHERWDDDPAKRVHIRQPPWLNPALVMCGRPETEPICCDCEWLDYDTIPLECRKCFKIVCPDCVVAAETERMIQEHRGALD
jgi:hypothetical protein